jgi:hypothetical protein
LRERIQKKIACEDLEKVWADERRERQFFFFGKWTCPPLKRGGIPFFEGFSILAKKIGR